MTHGHQSTDHVLLVSLTHRIDQDSAVPNKHGLQNNCEDFLLKTDLKENRNWINRKTLLEVHGI